MRSSASSVPKLPQGMARMKNSRKPSEHGLRLSVTEQGCDPTGSHLFL